VELSAGIHPRYWLGARALRAVAVASGVPLPRPEHVPLDDPLPIARWLAGTLASGRTPHVRTFASSAVLVAQAAVAAGIDLTGARFTAGGEPTTAVRLAAIRESGAEALPRFGTTETDIFAFACRAPEAADDMHLLEDRHAVVQSRGCGALPPRALLVSSLLDTAPVLLLNVSLGDEAELVERRCGCPLEALGYGRHIHTARSFEKLTAGGSALLDVDLVRVLEGTLPARFGGLPTDYQLVEDETDGGRPRLRLLVHPVIGELDEDALLEAFLEAVGDRGSGGSMAALQLRDGGILRVDRSAPIQTANGKINHVHHLANT
jgi:hypothetical protein